MDLKDRPGLRALKDRKDWQDIRAPKGLKVPQAPEESLARSDLRVLQGLRDLLVP